jgi:hypothetical protein
MLNIDLTPDELKAVLSLVLCVPLLVFTGFNIVQTHRNQRLMREWQQHVEHAGRPIRAPRTTTTAFDWVVVAVGGILIAGGMVTIWLFCLMLLPDGLHGLVSVVLAVVVLAMVRQVLGVLGVWRSLSARVGGVAVWRVGAARGVRERIGAGIRMLRWGRGVGGNERMRL